MSSRITPKRACSWSFGPKSWIKSLACSSLLLLADCSLSGRLRERFNEDWRFAETIRGSGASPLHRTVFGDAPLDGKLYREFFDQRVDEIKTDGFGFASCHGALACQTESRSIRLSEDYQRLAIPQVIRLSFLLHEARHAEGFRHVRCPSPFTGPDGKNVISPYQALPLRGKESCDRDELGAYGIQIVMLKNIENHCQTCSRETRKVAADYARFLLNLILSPSARKNLESDF